MAGLLCPECQFDRYLAFSVSVIETQERFEDLLMHGYLDHHRDPTRFTIDEFDSAKMEEFKKLVDRYFAAGYFDPGLMAVGFEERLRLAKKYPNQFDKSFSEIEFDNEGRT